MEVAPVKDGLLILAEVVEGARLSSVESSIEEQFAGKLKKNCKELTRGYISACHLISSFCNLYYF